MATLEELGPKVGERLRAALDAMRFDEPGVQGSAVESTPV